MELMVLNLSRLRSKPSCTGKMISSAQFTPQDLSPFLAEEFGISCVVLQQHSLHGGTSS